MDSMTQIKKEFDVDQIKIDEIQSKMEDLLPTSRYHHTLGVAHLASALAMCYGENPRKAMLAGLLHDNAKYIEYDVAIKECEENGITVLESQRKNPMLLHQTLGAFYASSKYGIEDEEILSAILYHTTGRPDMTFLEKVIFLADYIEPRRTQTTQPEIDVIRKTAFHNLDLAVYYALDNTLRFLHRTNRFIDVLSEHALEYYIRKNGL